MENMSQISAPPISPIETHLAKQGFYKIAENYRLEGSIANFVFFNPAKDEACVLFERSRLSKDILSNLFELRSKGYCVGLALPQRLIVEEVLKKLRDRGIGLLLVEPPEVQHLLPLPREKPTPAVNWFKRSIARGKLLELADRVSRWPTPAPLCPEHKIAAEPTVFSEGRIQMRGWRCKEGDLEIVHPLDAELSLYLNKFGPIKALISQVGGQFVVRLSKLVAARYHLRKGAELEVDVTDINQLKLRAPLGEGNAGQKGA